MIIPDFGTCGFGTNDDDDDDQAEIQKKSSCCSGQCSCDCEKKVEEIQEEVKQEIVKHLCYKCKEKPAVYKNKQAVVCRDCFMMMTLHSFKN